MNIINWGIIGCGDVVEIKSGPAFQNIKNSNLVTVMRRDVAKAEDFAKRHKVPNFSSDAADILNNKNINAIYIATPPSTHFHYAIMALNAGKHVYLEKPMTVDAIEAKTLAKTVAKSDSKLTVAHYRRQLPAFLKVKEILNHSIVGDVTHVDLKILQPRKSRLVASSDENWRLNPEISGGGYFYDLAPHQIDLMYQYFGQVENANGFSKPSKHNNKVEDVVNGIISFKNGVQFRGIWNFNTSEFNKKDECTIYGTKGNIKFSFFGDSVFLTTVKGTETFPFVNPKHVQEPMIKATVAYFLNKAANPCPVEDGLLVMELLEKLSGRTV